MFPTKYAKQSHYNYNLLYRKAQVPATNRHTNPPSTRVSLPTDTAEHAPNFLSPSTAEPSEVTPLINIVNC